MPQLHQAAYLHHRALHLQHRTGGITVAALGLRVLPLKEALCCGSSACEAQPPVAFWGALELLPLHSIIERAACRRCLRSPGNCGAHLCSSVRSPRHESA